MYCPFSAKQVFGLTAKTLTKRIKTYYQGEEFDERIYLQLLKCFQIREYLAQTPEFPAACFARELAEIYTKEEWSLWQLKFFYDLKRFFAAKNWVLFSKRYITKIRQLGYALVSCLKINQKTRVKVGQNKSAEILTTLFNVRVLARLKNKLKSLFENKLNNSS